MRAKVYEYLVLLMNEGNELRPPYSQLVESGIYEIRIRQSSNIISILYFFYSGKRIILTNGFVKKTQKTPPEEIQLAKARRKRFLEREGKC
ncbi:MAG: type II toxin-antitoxin system RelE/ParE family toxin [Erysipelotrichaceae bacterium]|nr:type II toxin-antitoxin system RelE/ParE family toxin [Erysipelotrichaceae bacterium]